LAGTFLQFVSPYGCHPLGQDELCPRACLPGCFVLFSVHSIARTWVNRESITIVGSVRRVATNATYGAPRGETAGARDLTGTVDAGGLIAKLWAVVFFSYPKATTDRYSSGPQKAWPQKHESCSAMRAPVQSIQMEAQPVCTVAKPPRWRLRFRRSGILLKAGLPLPPLP